MIVVDTNVWIDHLHVYDVNLAGLLDNVEVLQHPCVTTELALGSLANRARILAMLDTLPQAEMVAEATVLQTINDCMLFGTGIGYVDAQLLALTHRTAELQLWTRDKRLAAQAERLGCAYLPPG